MGRISNSFDYVPVRALKNFVLDPERCSSCSLGLARSKTSRVVLVDVGKKILLCLTKTEDFDDSEIRYIVHDLGQLYLDVSGKLQIDDFATDVRQLVVADECRTCENFETCVLCYREARTSFFEKDEEWLRGYLRGLVGRVLDVGIGRGRYIHWIKEQLLTGSVMVHGLDPAPALEGDYKNLQVFAVGIEQFELPDSKPYDHILAIRSLHHIEDLEVALAKMSLFLRPGGTLLLVESVALPLLRSKKQSLRAHAMATGGFQHVRNWDSHKMLAFIGDRFPFATVFHRPVAMDTCDQWMLVLEKRP